MKKPSLAIGLALVCLFVVTPCASAQYDVRETKLTRNEFKQLNSVVKDSLLSTSAYEANRDEFRRFFQEAFFPQMTVYSPPLMLSQVGKLRRALFRTYLWKSTDPRMQRDLTEMAMREMAPVVAGNYHPACRYNAIYLIGMLDETYAQNKEDKPVPLKKGTQFLINVLETDKFRDNVPRTSALALGALIGLERHARLGMASDLIPRANAAAMAILQQTTPADDVNKDVHNWMRCKAAIVLANLGGGDASAVYDGFMAMIGDSKINLDDRCCIAELLEKLDFEQASVDATSGAKVLVDLCVDVGKFEAKEASILQDMFTSGRIFRARPGALDDEGPTFERRRLLGRLLPLQTGLKAISAATSPETQEPLNEISVAIDAVIAAAEPKETLDLVLTEQIIGMSDTFDLVASNWGNPDAGDDDDQLEGLEAFD